MMNFGENFKNIRKQCGLSQQEVADKLQIKQSSVSDWENDVSRPDYEKLIALSELYDVTLYELLGID
ncbi:MAG: helix-turn-helix transcriptional regulator [Clostridiales bacterium]|jgi:transcriptional regulator with XRE-family HTH domain|nr:helix-turn-helix transcriptional regulator [Clostridiales bacterium]MDY2721593.1 helix-turn-helix transcriptional regulator [Eubacteriales bacterium]MDD7481453.1 helix-turn-helix transcriptional regulator [Clostridiales bacterium]MDY3236355.1 helix-turn-helix transcriptional regulator [Eubacteriales bacterium]MDY5630787.1 helix-turn-helix transcriptional regulator [Eubacteriales bacterium]